MFRTNCLTALFWQRLLGVAAAILILFLYNWTAQAEPSGAAEGFASADEAVASLIGALTANDTAAMSRIFGPAGEALINSGDPYADKRRRDEFLAAYNQQHKLVPAGEDRVVLDVGKDDWPLPIPIVKQAGVWHFDTAAGAQEIIDRRIGRDEIDAIRVSLFYADAQKDYFDRIKQTSGIGEYAQHLASTPNKHDGLYWPVAPGELESPLAPLIDQAIDEGYPGEIVSGIPYQGYYFRILKGQGESAPGGTKDYLVNGKMTGGFALLAWPATYRASGVMTFVVDRDGVVFQKDLGERTGILVGAIIRFDPDISWARVDVSEN